MSDTNYTPPPAAVPASAPSNETPIQTNQPSLPTPVGPQAPNLPPGEERRPTSRREAIQRAFDRVQGEGRPGPAEAKRGHNQPPEDTPREKPRVQAAKPKDPPPEDGIDLKKRPTEQPREKGRFARAPDVNAGRNEGFRQAPEEGAHPEQRPGRRHAPLPEHAPFRQAPPRFSPRAQEDWDVTPETVRGDIYRMHHEVNGMHEHYRNDKAVMDTIRPFQNMAQQHGTTLQKALGNYVGMEQLLRKDAIAGLDMIVNNLGLTSPDGQRIGLRDIAYYVLNQSPESHKLLQSQNTQQALTQQIGQLHQVVNRLAQGQQQIHNERQFTYTRSAVDQFADTHPRFDELGDLIEQELRLGFSLEQAYQRAELLRPGSSSRAAQTRNTTAQTRTDRSIHGAPESASADGSSRRSDRKVGRREAISNAIKRVNGSL